MNTPLYSPQILPSNRQAPNVSEMVVGWMNDIWMDRQMDGQTDGWVDGWMDNEWTDGWMWMDGYLDA